MEEIYKDIPCTHIKNMFYQLINKKIFLKKTTTLSINTNISIQYIKGTPLRSGHVTHLKRNFSKTYFFLLPTYLVCI